MKILLITNIYPYTQNIENSDDSKALHNLVKLWDLDVEVIRPLFLPTELKKCINFNVLQKEEIKINNVKLHPLPIWKVPKTNIYFYGSLIKYVNKNNINPDIIISHRLHSSIGATKLASTKGKPLILGIHNSDILHLQSKKAQKEYYYIFKKANFIACRSQSILNELISIYPEFTQKCFIAFSGIETEIITSLEINLEKMEEWKNEKRIIKFITVARLIKLKNIDINLKALANLDQNIRWQYTIIGDGEEMPRLKKLALELGIEDKVFFKGYQNRAKVLQHLEKSDIFIMVSAPETFGLVYIEAMAKGCLIIGAYNNGIDGVVKDGINGFLCKPKNTIELTEKVKSIIIMNNNKLSKVINESYNTINYYTEEKASSVYLDKIREALIK